MNSKRTFLLSIYFLSSLIISIIYWFEDFNDSTIHRIGSVMGIFSFIWLSFNVITVTKMKIIETNFSLKGILRFHIIMSTIAILLGAFHSRLTLNTPYRTNQIVSGAIPALFFIILLPLASIYMTNHTVKNKLFMNRRISRFVKKIEYNFHKILHNVTVLAVLVIFVHTMLSTTINKSPFITGVYSFFFGITLIAWVYHKVIRKFLSKSDPYIYRKASWDTPSSEISQQRNSEWAVNLMRKNPSLYPCLQCGSCTLVCPVSEVTEGNFNPRMIMENSLLGLKNKAMIEKMPNVWECTTCYSCVEVCPQHVELTEIFMDLKNQFAESNKAPEKFISEAETVYNTGESIPLQNAIIERRKKLDLPPQPELDIQEIQDILNDIGFDKLVGKSKNENLEGRA